MSKELEILQAVKSRIQTYLELADSQVVVNDWPEVDKMHANVMVYVVPDRIEIIEGAINSDNCKLVNKIYILVKGKAIEYALHDCLDYWSKIHGSIITDATLDGSVAIAKIVDADIYPAVLTNTSGVEITLEAIYERGAVLVPGEFPPGEYAIPIGG